MSLWLPTTPQNHRRDILGLPTVVNVSRIAPTKAKRPDGESQAPSTHDPNTKPLPTCPRRLRIFWRRIALVGHIRARCSNNRTTGTLASANAYIVTPGSGLTMAATNGDRTLGVLTPQPTLSAPTTHITLIKTPATAIIASQTPITGDSTPLTIMYTSTAPITNNVDSIATCLHWDHTTSPRASAWSVFLRTSRTGAGAPVPEAPTYT
ncbi:hypothetical protein SprV_0100110800 [Sparganum proliferum]